MNDQYKWLLDFIDEHTSDVYLWDDFSEYQNGYKDAFEILRETILEKLNKEDSE
jgi:hypothetical protein